MTAGSAFSERFCEFCINYDLIQMVREPTRYENVLDLAIVSSNNVTIVNQINVIQPFSCSDHNMIELGKRFTEHLKKLQKSEYC